MRSLTVIAIALVVLHEVSAHQMRLGKCRDATPMKDFSPDKFNGTWYVIEQLVTSSDCLMTTFNLTGNSSMTIQEMRAPLITQSLPIEVTFTNVGKLEMDPVNKAQMRLKWDGNLLNKIMKTTFTVVATDYVTYGLEVECQNWGFFNRISATIYSRTNNLSDDVITDLRKQLRDNYGIDLSRMNRIDHSDCIPLDKTEYNIKYDENGLSLMGLLSDKNLTKLETEQEVHEYLGLNNVKPAAAG